MIHAPQHLYNIFHTRQSAFTTHSELHNLYLISCFRNMIMVFLWSVLIYQARSLEPDILFAKKHFLCIGGDYVNGSDFSLAHRQRLVEHAKDHSDMDIQFSNYVQCSEEVCEQMAARYGKLSSYFYCLVMPFNKENVGFWPCNHYIDVFLTNLNSQLQVDCPTLYSIWAIPYFCVKMCSLLDYWGTQSTAIVRSHHWWYFCMALQSLDSLAWFCRNSASTPWLNFQNLLPHFSVSCMTKIQNTEFWSDVSI